jgi:hypothetical protein
MPYSHASISESPKATLLRPKFQKKSAQILR